MPGTRRWIAFGFFLATPVFLVRALPAQTATPASESATPHHHHKSHKTLKPLVLPPLPAGPLSQLPMEQIPPTPAKVSYQGGLLAISAQNSTLSEILRDVRKLTGASIEIPQSSGVNERVVTNLGPGAPRDVLAGLLNGTSFNYVMLGSSSDPTAVSSVILTAKSSGGAAAETQTAANENNQVPNPANRFPQPMPFNRSLIGGQPGQPPNAQPAPAAEDDSKDEEDSKDDDDSTDDQAQVQPGQPDVSGVAQEVQQPDPNAGPKTPEQILEMLRRQQPGAPVMGGPQPPQQPPQQQQQ